MSFIVERQFERQERIRGLRPHDNWGNFLILKENIFIFDKN